ncbi:MAG: hypothetical protein WCO68_05655 [Verrucomicrobiota bacterium]
MKTNKAILALGILSVFAFAQARATVIVTYAEAPGAETSSLVNASTFTFNDLSAGIHTNVEWDDVGTFDKINILAANQYGGAGNTNYAVEGLGSVSQTILNLDHSSSYFGMWWSAGDAANVLDFYSGANGTGTLLAQFTTANLLKTLPKAYYGNPNTGTNAGKDPSEPFAFINFFATAGSSWSSVVFKNSSSSGFEGDNYTSRVAVFNSATDGPMPGVVLEAINGTKEVYLAQAPEPNATLAMLLLGGLSAGGSCLRRFKK